MALQRPATNLTRLVDAAALVAKHANIINSQYIDSLQSHYDRAMKQFTKSFTLSMFLAFVQFCVLFGITIDFSIFNKYFSPVRGFIEFSCIVQGWLFFVCTYYIIKWWSLKRVIKAARVSLLTPPALIDSVYADLYTLQWFPDDVLGILTKIHHSTLYSSLTQKMSALFFIVIILLSFAMIPISYGVVQFLALSHVWSSPQIEQLGHIATYVSILFHSAAIIMWAYCLVIPFRWKPLPPLDNPQEPRLF